MQCLFLRLVFWVCLCSGPLSAAFPGLRYLGDIGDLAVPDDARKSVQFGKIRAIWADDHVRFEGRDDDGKSWRAILDVEGGLGYAAVWQADFDHNSRQDLLIAQYSPKSGRCTLPVTLSFLLFNAHGQPVPWVIQTQAPSLDLPVIFADLNHNGRAEVVVTNCAYRDGPSLGTDLSITGIYEAKDATWSIVRPTHLDAYTAVVRRSYHFGPEDQLVTANATDWPDQGNRVDLRVAPVELAGLMKASEDCRGVRLPPIVNGRLLERSAWKDPCEELGRNRIELSNKTVCYGWPTVMLDGAERRAIVAESEHPEVLLEKIIHQRRKVILIGQRDPNRCSPVLLWAAPAE